MYTLKYGSTDSLSAWASLPNSTLTAYALRKISPDSAPPVLADRLKVGVPFRRTDLSRRRRLRSTNASLKAANALRAKNTRLIRDMKVLENELKDARHKKQLTECEKQIDREYAIFNKKINALKEESVEMLMCSAGDGELADRVQQHLAEVTKFFNDKMSTIISSDSNWSMRHKTLVAEKLRDVFKRNVSKMNEWVDALVKINELPVLN